MRKIKSYIWALVSVMVAICCFGLVACANETPPDNTGGGNKDVEYTITWTVEHATVAATGYDTLPTKLKSGTEVVFTVTVDEGWELLGVAPTNNVTEQADGSYKFTVSNNLEVRVLTQEEGGLPPITDQCIIGWVVNPLLESFGLLDYDELPLTLAQGTVVKFIATAPEGYVVTVSPETIVKQSDGMYIFEVSGVAMSIVVSMEEQSVPAKQCAIEWDIDEHVTVTATGYAELPTQLAEGTKVTFTVTPESGYTATVTTEGVTEKADGEYTFQVTDDMTIEVTAEEKPALFDLANVCFAGTVETVNETIDDYTHEVFIRPFRAMGKFIGGQSAYIKLVEVESRKAFVGETVTRGDEDDDWFTLKFDYRVLVDEYGDVGFNEYVDFEVYICVTDSDGNEHAVRLDTADYEIDGRLVFTSYKEVDYTRRNVKYTVDYYSNTQENPANTKVFIALTAAESINYMLDDAQIVIDDSGDKEVPYLEITGRYYASYVREEALEALNNFVEDICAFNQWQNPRTFTQTAELDDHWYFTVSINLSKLLAGKTYVMHSTIKQFNSNDEGNLIFSSTNFDKRVDCNYIGYTLVEYDTDWGWYWPGIQLVALYNPNKSMGIAGTTVKAVDGKPYYTITYAYGGYSQEEIEALPVNFDLQCNDNINGGGWTRYFFDDKISFVIDEENSTFDVRIDISSLRGLHGYTTHYSLDKDDGERVGETNNPEDYKPNIDGVDGVSVACGDLTYTFTYKKGSGDGHEYWGCVGLQITNTPGYSATVNTTVQLAAENDKMYVVITGTYEGYTVDALKDRVLVDYQAPDNGWATTQFTAERLIITADEEAGTFTVKADITNVANGQYLLHFNGTDIGNENGIEAITCGSKTYAYVFRQFDGWSRYVLTIADAE